MDVFVLFSGGKDSSLSAILLEPFFDVTLVTCNFGFVETWEPAEVVASELGFQHRVVQIDGTILEAAYEMAINDGYPNRAINHLHACSLECAASGHAIIADGTRRDDRVPMLKLPDVQRLEDTRKCTYIRPLLGYGRRAVDALTDIHLEIEENESEKIEKSDYEVELRAIIEEMHGPVMVRTIFPGRHLQSRVIGRKTAPGSEQLHYDGALDQPASASTITPPPPPVHLCSLTAITIIHGTEKRPYQKRACTGSPPCTPQSNRNNRL